MFRSKENGKYVSIRVCRWEGELCIALHSVRLKGDMFGESNGLWHCSHCANVRYPRGFYTGCGNVGALFFLLFPCLYAGLESMSAPRFQCVRLGNDGVRTD